MWVKVEHSEGGAYGDNKVQYQQHVVLLIAGSVQQVVHHTEVLRQVYMI